MNTPTHVAASLLVWRNEVGPRAAAAVTIGALLPDAPMYGFYAYQRLVAHRSEREIWSTLYFDESWQWLFDWFNSLPLYLAMLLFCRWRGMRTAALLAASALLHVCCDLPVHHDDAHRHFLPLSSWRFMSPLSYWDPQHYGHLFVWLELAFAVGACLFVGTRGQNTTMRKLAYATLAIYAIGIAFAVVMWLPESAGPPRSQS